MVSMMEAKTSLFLKQSQLLLQIHSINDSRNAQECLDCIQAICATLSNTYGGEISGPHINVPLDPKHLMLIWDMEAFFTRLHFEVILLTHRSTVSLVLGRHYTSLQIPRDSQSIFLCFLSLTTDGYPLNLSPTYHQMHGGYSEVNIDCIKMLLITSEIQIQFMREKHYLPGVFDSHVSPTGK